MKYLSLDIETGGLNRKMPILQIAVVVDDLHSRTPTPIDQLPRFCAFVKHDNPTFEPYALNLHMKTGLLQRYLADQTKVDFGSTMKKLVEFLRVYYPLQGKEKYNAAGKNLAGFDLPFIREARHDAGPFQNSNIWTTADGVYVNHVVGDFLDKINHRIIDPAVFYTDFLSDKGAVSLDDCKDRAGITTGPVTHDALDDALDVVRVIRNIANFNQGRFADVPYAENT